MLELNNCVLMRTMLSTFKTLQKGAEKLGLIINTNKTKYMQLTRKTNKINQDIEVEEKSL